MKSPAIHTSVPKRRCAPALLVLPALLAFAAVAFTQEIAVSTGALGNFTAYSYAASGNQTLTLNGTNLASAVTINATGGYEVSTDGANFSTTIRIAPNQNTTSIPLHTDNASNYGGGWNGGSNGGTGFGAWQIQANNGTGFAGSFIGDPAAAGISGFGSPAFGLYANPGGSGATVTVSRPLAQALPVGGSFSLQWATNWDSDVGNKGFNIFAGGAEIVNVNQGGFPGNITCNGQLAIDGGTGFGTQPMTWTFARTSETNLRVTSTDRKGGTTPVFTADIPITAAPDSFSFYSTAMGAGDQRQPYFNNLRIGSLGGNLSATVLHVRLAAGGSAGPANGTLTLAAGNATRTVSLTGQVLPSPSIATSPISLSGFLGIGGNPSAAKSFTANGSFLQGNITVSAPAGFEVSTDNQTFTNSATLAAIGGNLSATVFVRIAAGNATNPALSGNIALSSPFAASASVAVSGNTLPAPSLSASPESLSGLKSSLGRPSIPASFFLLGQNLLGNATLSAPENFEISTDGFDFFSTLELSPDALQTVGGLQIFARITADAPLGAVSGSLYISSEYAQPASVALSGSVEIGPFIEIGGGLEDLPRFSSADGVVSEPQAFSANGYNLGDGIEISAPLHFEISVGNGTFGGGDFVEQTGGIAQAVISVRVAATAPVGNHTGTVLLSSRGAVTRSVRVYATVGPKLTIASNLETLVEGDEFSEAQITLRRSGPITSSLTVNLTENLGSLLQVDLLGDLDYKNLPINAIIPADSEFVEFYVRARENSIRAGKSRLIASATGLASASINFTLTENDQGSSYLAWLNGAQHSSKNLELYALGGGTIVGQAQLPVLTMNATHTILTAGVRTDDPWLNVTGESTNDLKNGPWTPVNLSVDPNQNGLSAGFERRFFSIPRQPGETRKFLRFRLESKE